MVVGRSGKLHSFEDAPLHLGKLDQAAVIGFAFDRGSMALRGLLFHREAPCAMNHRETQGWC